MVGAKCVPAVIIEAYNSSTLFPISIVDPDVTNTWTEVNKGVSNTWTEVNKGVSNTWVEVDKAA